MPREPTTADASAKAARRRWLVVAGAVVGALLVLALILSSIVWFPSLLVRDTAGMERKDVLAAENAVRGTLLTAIAGALFLLTAGFTWRQLGLAQRQTELTRESQITDRYAAAVKQVASGSLTERIGGIYALQRIAEDSQRDEPTIVRLLSAFCRECRAPAEGDVRRLRERDPDVQIALDVLGAETVRTTAELFDAHLEKAAFDKTPHLKGANLAGAHLEGAYLVSADLEGAILFGANLAGAYLVGANLSGAALEGATLTGAHLEEANLTGATRDKDTKWPDGFTPPAP
jgi:hypothetical protein